MNRRFVRRSLLGLAVGLCVAVPAVVAQRAASTPRTITVGSLDREYLLHVPADLPDAAVPVVFAFHGGGGTARGTARLTKLDDIADREKFLVVYPQGIGRGWNDGRDAKLSQAHRDDVDDLAFFDAVLASVAHEYRIDMKRVFATGISNGGIFSHYLAANRSGSVAAIAPVVGGLATPFHQRFRPAAPVSVLVIQGTADPLVPYDGGKVAERTGRDHGRIIGTEEAIHLWTRANGCAEEPVITPMADRDPTDACRTEERRWRGGRDGTEVVLWRVENGGHTWPDGMQYLPERIIGRVTHDFGSADIWEFFKSHPKP